MKISLNLIQYLSIWPKTFSYPPPALVQLPIILCSRYYFLSCLLVITTPPPPTPTTHRTDVLNNGREGGDPRAYNVTVNYGQCGMLLAFHIFSNQHYSAKDFFREALPGERMGLQSCLGCSISFTVLSSKQWWTLSTANTLWTRWSCWERRA